MKKLIQKLNISKKEWRFVVLLTIVVVIITTLPYLYGYLSAPKDKIYNGMHMLTPGDIYVYFSYLEQTAQGNFLFKNLFTSETTMPVFNIFLLTVGFLGKTFNLSHILTFQLSRILLIPISVIILYLFISYIFSSKQIRKITLTVLIFSSGTGALASFFLPTYLSNKSLFYWPMDLWSPANITFLTLYHSPHIIASLTLIILIFLFFLKATEENNYKYSTLAGLCGMLLMQFHPFHLPTIVLVPAFYIFAKWTSKRAKQHPIWHLAPKHIINWRDIKHLFIFYILTAPSVLYYVWLMNFDWATSLKAFQNTCYTPRFFVVLISYGGLLIFSFITILAFIFKGVKHPFRCSTPNHTTHNHNKLLFLVVWAITQFTLIFMPFRFQRRLSEGLQIPLVFLTIIALFWIKEKFKDSPFGKIFLNKFSITLIFILFFTSSNLFVVIKDMQYFKNKNELFYFAKQQMQSYEFFKNEVSGEEVILSGIINGNAIPGIAGRKVYLGHVHIETLYYDSKLAYVNWFFKDNINDEKKIDFLRQNNIKYVYYSKYEKEMGNFNPENKSYLNKIYSNDFATIYKVNKDTRIQGYKTQ